MLQRTIAVTALVLLLLAPAASSQQRAHSRILGSLDLGPGSPVAINVNNQVALVAGHRSAVWTEWSGTVDLGGFDPDVPQTRVTDLSDAGYAVGRVLSAFGFYHPFLWHGGTGLIDAESDPALEAAAWAVNNGGEMVGGGPGLSFDPDGTAFRRTVDGVVTRLNPLGGTCGSAAYDINDAGVAVGESSYPGSCSGESRSRPFIWTGNGDIRDIGTLGGHEGAAIRINSQGQVTGHSTTAAGHWHAFLWSPRGGMRGLGTLGGAWSRARALNEFGHVVGSTLDARGRQRAFLWTPTTGMIDLGAGEARAINEFDHVVGSWADDTGLTRAFLWTPWDGRIVLAENARAIDVNNNGYIAGATHVSGSTRAVIWKAAITDADWLTYRRGLVDAHLAYGSLQRGHATALRAMLNNAERAMRAGDQNRTQRSIALFSQRFHEWKRVEELPYE